jgi:hypothetical protein
MLSARKLRRSTWFIASPFIRSNVQVPCRRGKRRYRRFQATAGGKRQLARLPQRLHGNCCEQRTPRSPRERPINKTQIAAINAAKPPRSTPVSHCRRDESCLSMNSPQIRLRMIFGQKPAPAA